MKKVLFLAGALALACAAVTAQEPPRPVADPGPALLDQARERTREMMYWKGQALALGGDQKKAIDDKAALRALGEKVARDRAGVDADRAVLRREELVLDARDEELRGEGAGLKARLEALRGELKSFAEVKKGLDAEKARVEEQGRRARTDGEKALYRANLAAYKKNAADHDRAVAGWRGRLGGYGKDLKAHVRAADVQKDARGAWKELDRALRFREGACLVAERGLERKNSELEGRRTGLHGRAEVHRAEWRLSFDRSQLILNRLRAAATLPGAPAALRAQEAELRQAQEDARKAEEERRRLDAQMAWGP